MTTDPFDMFPWVFSFVIGVIFGAAIVLFIAIANHIERINIVCEVL